jgi:Uncharacterized conserved protein
MVNWFKRSSGSSAAMEDYKEIDLSEYEGVAEEAAKMYIKVGKMASTNELPAIKKEVYGGNIVILDISLIKNDEIALNRVLRDFKQMAEDIRGDVAGVGEDQVILAPTSVKVDRTRILGRRI